MCTQNLRKWGEVRGMGSKLFCHALIWKFFSAYIFCFLNRRGSGLWGGNGSRTFGPVPGETSSCSLQLHYRHRRKPEPSSFTGVACPCARCSGWIGHRSHGIVEIWATHFSTMCLLLKYYLPFDYKLLRKVLTYSVGLMEKCECS